MGDIPLHPALVHVPLGLAFLMPFVALGLALAMHRGWLPPRAWIVAVALQAVVAGAAIVAVRTGEQEEDRVEQVVAESTIEAHAERGEVFAWGAGLALAMSAVVLALRGRGKIVAAAAATGAMVVVAGLAVRVGHAGGQLVYVHGAGAAYATSTRAAPPVVGEREKGGRERD